MQKQSLVLQRKDNSMDGLLTSLTFAFMLTILQLIIFTYSEIRNEERNSSRFIVGIIITVINMFFIFGVILYAALTIYPIMHGR